MVFNLLIVFLIFVSSNLWAQSSNLNLSLKEVIRVALEKNPALMAKKEKFHQLEAETRLSKSAIYPVMSWNLTDSYLKDASGSGSPKFKGDPYHQYSSDLKLIQPLYSRGLLSAVEASAAEKKILDASLSIDQRNLVQNIISAFYRLVLSQNNLENLKKNKELVLKSLTISNQRYQKGRGQWLDVLQVKTQLALIEPLIEEAHNQFEIASFELASFMGESLDLNYKVKGDLKTLFLKDIQKIIDLNKIELPEYEMNQWQLNQLGYNKEVVLGKHFPVLKLVGDYFHNNYSKSDLFNNRSHSFSIQVQLSIPIFSGFSMEEDKAIMASKHMALTLERKNLYNSFSLKQEASLKKLKSSESSLISSAEAVKIALESEAEAGRIYKLSQIDFLQYLSVQQSALKARLNYDSLKYQNIIAYSNYFAALGKPLSLLVDVLSE